LAETKKLLVGMAKEAADLRQAIGGSIMFEAELRLL
jgi:hypothetical protein